MHWKCHGQGIILAELPNKKGNTPYLVIQRRVREKKREKEDPIGSKVVKMAAVGYEQALHTPLATQMCFQPPRRPILGKTLISSVRLASALRIVENLRLVESTCESRRCGGYAQFKRIIRGQEATNCVQWYLVGAA